MPVIEGSVITFWIKFIWEDTVNEKSTSGHYMHMITMDMIYKTSTPVTIRKNNAILEYNELLKVAFSEFNDSIK